jgi:DNA-binding response OmpR family regulator
VEAKPRRVVLVVDDDQAVADSFDHWLADSYETRVAYGGEQALELADTDVDAVLLDRRMPDLHGDVVLERLRERGLECAIIMTTAVDPDLNILEMDFDDYLCKPVDHETLVSTLETHLDRADHADPRLEEFFTIRSKLAVLEDERSRLALRDDEEYQRLQERADDLGAELRATVEDFDTLVAAHREVDRSSQR